MSKLEQLIEELCPNGVEYIALENLCKTNISPKKIPSNDVKDTGKYPVIDQGANFISGFTDNEQALLGLNKYIIFGDHTEIIKYVDFDFAQGADGIKILTAMNCDCRYLYHAFSCKYTKKGKYTRHWSNAKKTLIPLPPLQVQREVVRILDTFSEYTIELTEELTMRKKQYEYYRDNLFSFDSCEYEQRLLGEIGEVRMCKRILKEQTLDIGDIPFYKIGTFGKEANAYISQELFEEYKSKYNYPKIGDVLISASGTIGRTVVFDGKDAYFQDSNIVWIENDESIVLNKYLFHFYKIAKWHISEGGTIQRLYNDNLKKTNIPVPYPNDKEKSLTEQQRIVDILDRFDTLCNDISKGLPAEIEVRKKQYEYYRNKLLSFKEIS